MSDKPVLFFVFKKKREGSIGQFCIFSGQWLAPQEESTYWLAWHGKGPGGIIASRNTKTELLKYLDDNFGIFKYVEVDATAWEWRM